jgi:hypothetical protein
MYLSNTTEKFQVVLGATVTTNQLEWHCSYQDITSAGMTLPQSSSQGLTNNTTDVDLVAAPAASTTRQVIIINIYNDDTVSQTVTVKKDVGGTDYILWKGILLAGNTLFWSRENGWSVISGTSQSNYTFDVFTSNGTWTKPAGLKAAMVFVGGAGGGAGSGARNAAGTNRFGGGGGAGGSWFIQLFDANSLASTVAITVGTGGTGGAAILVDTTNGANGTAGGQSQFGSMIALGGGAGSGGTTAAGTAGTGNSSALFLPYSGAGANGNSGSTNTASGAGGTGFQGLTANVGCPGGAGGSGISSGNVSATSAGAGGAIYQNGILIAGPTAGASPNGINNKNIFVHMSQSLTSGTGVGTGGAGGYPSAGTYNGGNGGYCAGGGGGAGSLNGTASGKGGDGGGGLVIVMNIF